mgnify:CR=1 FL=1
MRTYHYDFDNKKHSCNLEIEIDYDKIPAETHRADFREHTTPGQIDLVNVRVYAIEGYDDGGQLVYRLKRGQITPSWVGELDALAYEWVENEIDLDKSLHEALWENDNEW